MMYKIVLLFLIGEVFNFVRYFFSRYADLAVYSIPFSLLQGTFLTAAEFLLITKFAKNLKRKKLLLLLLCLKSFVFFSFYCFVVL